MVGYDPKKNLTQIDIVVAGTTSGVITRLLCQPLDVLKIRFQLQVEPIRRNTRWNSKYSSMFQATRLIIHEEGVRALWKGHIPGQLLSISYGIAQFSSYEFLTKQASTFGINDKWGSAIHFTSGMASGCIATLVSFPFDVVRTRLVAQSEKQIKYKGVTDGFRSIIKHEGPLVLFRGVLPTFLQVGPHAGAQFMFYKIFDNIYKTVLTSNDTTTFTSSAFAGSSAGFCAKIVVYPLDVVKKRLQIQGFDRGNMFGSKFTCSGMFSCLVKTFQKEGFSGFFKGMNAGLVKAVVTSAMYFSTYEMACEFIQKYRYT